MKDIDKVTLSYNDSRNPGRVVLSLPVDGYPAGRAKLDLSAADAVALADRLLTAVRSEGFTLTAKHRNAR